jgi:plasmid segregation protein ParM
MMKARLNGYDIGNYSLKVAPALNIKSLISTEENILGSKIALTYEARTYYIGEGTFETELNKGNKENYLPLLFTGIALTSSPEEIHHKIVCGLPINQYQENKYVLEDLILSKQTRQIELNGVTRDITITDCKVYPEALGAYYSLDTSDDLIIADIGGRTTDIAYIASGKLEVAATVNVGTLNIYKDIAGKLNSTFSLDLDIQKVDRIVERGYLKVDGEEINLHFVTDLLRTNFLKIKEDLDFKFPARTEKIVLVGGGAKLFEKAFKKRYQDCYIADNPIYANAIGFQRVGEMIWG